MRHVSPEWTGPDETVLYAADRVRTLLPEQPLAEALVTRGGKVVAVGGRRELQAAQPGVRVVELRGATIVPGLADAHAHLAGLGRTLSILNFAGTTSVEQILELAKTAPPSSYEGEWLVGRGLHCNDLTEGRRAFPTREQRVTVVSSTSGFVSFLVRQSRLDDTHGLDSHGVPGNA